MRLRWCGTGPGLDERFQRLAGEFGMTLKEAVEGSETFLLRSIAIADSTHHRDVVAHYRPERTRPRRRFEQRGERCRGVRRTGRADDRGERALAVAFTKLCEGVRGFKASLNEILKITVNLAGAVGDHDLGHLG